MANQYYNALHSLTDVLRDRKEYKVYQANILAQSYGNLTDQEIKIFDFFLTFIKKSDKFEEGKLYQTSFKEIIDTVEKSKGGSNYKTVVNTISKLQGKTQLLIPIEKVNNGRLIKGFKSVPMFYSINFWEKGGIDFAFHPELAPFLYELAEEGNFFGIEYKQILKLRSEYAMKIHKLWRAKQYSNNKYTEVSGSLDEWKLWLLGKDIAEDPKKSSAWTAGRMKSQLFLPAIAKLEKNFHVKISIFAEKSGRKIIAYTLKFVELSSKEILAINSEDDVKYLGKLIEEKKQLIEDEDKIMQEVIEYSIKTNQSLLEAASDLKRQKIIEYIPSKLLITDNKKG